MFWSQVVLYSRSAANGSEKTTGLIWSTRATLEELNKTSDPTDGMERIINVLHRNQNKTQSVLSYTHTHTHKTDVFYSPPLRSWSRRVSIPPADRSQTERPLSQTQYSWRSTRWATDRQTDTIRHV